jgi:hypothetical protein
MLKKLVVLGIAGLMGMFLMVGSSYAKYSQGGGGCGGSQDQCEVNPTSTLQATIGMDVKLDFDVCVEWPEDLCGYNGCEQAIIAQKGQGNYGEIDQTGANFALIYQNGNYNWAYAYQDVENGGALALIFQNGSSNGASVTQNAAASALVYQEGSYNIGIISQQ